MAKRPAFAPGRGSRNLGPVHLIENGSFTRIIVTHPDDPSSRTAPGRRARIPHEPGPPLWKRSTAARGRFRPGFYILRKPGQAGSGERREATTPPGPEGSRQPEAFYRTRI